MLKAKLGIAPIAWWNDDLAELSDDVSLEECLRQASVAGFTGMETGRRFPMNMTELGPVLKRYGISVCGGWFSGLLLDSDITESPNKWSSLRQPRLPASSTVRPRAQFRAIGRSRCRPSRSSARTKSKPTVAR
jgi:hypothetical protein